MTSTDLMTKQQALKEQNQRIKRTIVSIIAAFFVVATIAGHSGGKGPGTSSTCSDDWTKCKDNTELANNWSGVDTAQGECRVAADDEAKYGEPKWPWHSFSFFHPDENSAVTGTYTLIENNAHFQNGFGAWVHAKVLCEYDLRLGKVNSVEILDR